MEFSYTAANVSGTKQKGTIEARSEKEIVEFLKKNSLTPIEIKKNTKKGSITFFKFEKIKKSDITLFTRQLSSMITTGLTLIEALNILKTQSGNAKLQAVIEDLVSSISEGKSFSESLSMHKNIFSNVYIALVRAAESGGLLDKLLTRLADNLEKTEEIEKNIKSAMFYPAVIITMMIGVIVIMNVVVIPQLSSLYEGMNIELPFITRIVVNLSKLMINYWYLFIIAAISIFIFLKSFMKTEYGKKITDKIKMKAPVLGNIVVLSNLNQITNTIALLIHSGTSILDALEISANVSTNSYYREAVLSSRQLVEKGVSMSTAFQNQQVFPLLMIQMTKVGEETGKIDESLERVAEYFERDLNLKIKTLTTAIEPILIVVLGVIVGFLILAVITPIYTLVTQIK